jgi:hypothetical protein
MAPQLIVTFPSTDPGLRRAVEQGVEEYADVRQSQSYTDAETVKLVLDIVAQGISIAGGVAGIITFLRSLQQTKQQQGQTITIMIEAPGHPAQPIDQADADLLARLLSTSTPN